MPKKMPFEKYKPFLPLPLHLPDREWPNRQITKAPLSCFKGQGQITCGYHVRVWNMGPGAYNDKIEIIDEVRERIRKTLAFVESVKEDQFAGASERRVRLSWAPGKVIGGIDYLLQVTIPNVFFHITTAYAILRHNGVDVGKMDFLGAMNFVDG